MIVAASRPTPIGGIERGKRNVGVRAIFRLARAQELHPAGLFER